MLSSCLLAVSSPLKRSMIFWAFSVDMLPENSLPFFFKKSVMFFWSAVSAFWLSVCLFCASLSFSWASFASWMSCFCFSSSGITSPKCVLHELCLLMSCSFILSIWSLIVLASSAERFLSVMACRSCSLSFFKLSMLLLSRSLKTTSQLILSRNSSMSSCESCSCSLRAMSIFSPMVSASSIS